MKVTIDYVPGPEPNGVIFEGIKEITTVADWGYIRLVLHKDPELLGKHNCEFESYSTPLYLIKEIHIEQENKTNETI